MAESINAPAPVKNEAPAPDVDSGQVAPDQKMDPVTRFFNSTPLPVEPMRNIKDYHLDIFRLIKEHEEAHRERMRVENERDPICSTPLEEITKHNHGKVIDELLELIGRAEFIAVDATVETTGFVIGNEEFNPAYMSDCRDCFGEWYDLIKDVEESYCLLEVGLTVFYRKRGSPLTELNSESFNIPAIPAYHAMGINATDNPGRKGRPRARTFLDRHGKEFVKSARFDLNKLLYLGAPYMNRNLCEEANQYMKDNPGFMADARSSPIDPSYIPELRDKVTEKDRKKIIEGLRGVSKIFDKISSTGIPIVGHDLFLKMIFIYKDFIEYLPDTYPEYCDKLRSVFKLIYDTKFLASEIRTFLKLQPEQKKCLYDLRLQPLLRNLNRRPLELQKYTVKASYRNRFYCQEASEICHGQEEVEGDLSSYSNVAGFDSYISGLLFLDLVTIMEANRINCWPEFPEGEELSPQDQRFAVGHGGQLIFYENYNEPQYRDYLDMFMKGYPSRFKYKLFGEPEPFQKRTSVFQLLTANKKEMRRRIEEEKKNGGNSQEKRLSQSSHHDK